MLLAEISGAQVNNNINIDINKDSSNIRARQEPEPEPSGTKIGILGARFMPTISSVKLHNASGNTIKGEFIVSYGYGGLVGLNFSNNFGLQLEGIYNELSQKYKDQNLERKIQIKYLNFPLLLSLNTGRLNMVNLNIVGGPQFGLNVGSSVTTTGSGEIDTVHAILAIKKSDFGLAYGAGLDFGLNKKRTARLDIGFRGVYGLINISDESGTIETGQYYILQKTHIETYSAYLGFLFLF